jgi:hypothetical protein
MSGVVDLEGKSTGIVAGQQALGVVQTTKSLEGGSAWKLKRG